MNYSSNSTITQQGINNQEELQTTSNVFNIDLRPGYETHLEGTYRLSPYFGAELIFELQSSSQTIETVQGGNVEETTISNGRVQGNGPTSPGFTRLGLNGVAGADYYFAEKLYLGVEVNLGFQYTLNSDITVETTGSGQTPPDRSQANDYSLTTGSIGTFRLGYVF